jgi:hypothetical protein
MTNQDQQPRVRQTSPPPTGPGAFVGRARRRDAQELQLGRDLPALRLNGPRDAERAATSLDAAGLPHEAAVVSAACADLLGLGLLAIAWGSLCSSWPGVSLFWRQRRDVVGRVERLFRAAVAGALLLAVVTLASSSWASSRCSSASSRGW